MEKLNQGKETLNSQVLNLAKDIYCLMKKLNLNKYHLIGHDFGAYVSSYLCLLYKKEILSLTLMSMPFPGPPIIKNIGIWKRLIKNLPY